MAMFLGAGPVSSPLKGSLLSQPEGAEVRQGGYAAAATPSRLNNYSVRP